MRTSCATIKSIFSACLRIDATGEVDWISDRNAMSFFCDLRSPCRSISMKLLSLIQNLSTLSSRMIDTFASMPVLMSDLAVEIDVDVDERSFSSSSVIWSSTNWVSCSVSGSRPPHTVSTAV